MSGVPVERERYGDRPLDVGDVDPDPFVQVRRWLDEWIPVAPREPMAAVLATAPLVGPPAARTVLVRGFDERGATFYTNRQSRKGGHLAERPEASLLLAWVPVLRQVELVGPVVEVPEEESDAYFAGRPRGSQLAAWASTQSSFLADRAELEASFAEAEARFEGGPVARPPHWGGYRLVPDTIELWQGRDDRMHDRLRYVRTGDGWDLRRVAP